MKPTALMLLALLLALLSGCPSADPEPDPDPTPSDEEDASIVVSPLEAEDLDPQGDILHVALTASPIEVGLDGEPGYAYNGQIPGPTLRATVGDTLVVDLQNDLDTPTTIHWHGVRVPWAMDGAPWMVDPVGPGESTTITFTLGDAGTFWYHPHFDTAAQVDLGLYGVLVVQDPDEPDVPDVVLVFDDAAEDTDGTDPDAHIHADELPSRWLVNGIAGGTLVAPPGEPLRARLLNASNIAYLALRWPGMRVLAHDQGLLPALSQPSLLVLAPGDRAEVEWLVAGEIEVVSEPWSLHGGPASGEVEPVLQVTSTSNSGPTAASWPFATREPPSDPGRTDVRYVFQGDGEQWMINGELFPDVTVASVALDAETIMEVRNVSPTRHPFHLHGHSFEVLSDADGPATEYRLEDTIDVGIREVLRLRVLADNPGDWMVHCHLLPHAEQGMMTVFRVEDDDAR